MPKFTQKLLEYVAGHDLRSIVKRRHPLPVDLAVNYVIQAAIGLSYTHQRGVVHRDVKPGNLLLNDSGMVKILDLGLARIHYATGDLSTGPTPTELTTVSLRAKPASDLRVKIGH